MSRELKITTLRRTTTMIPMIDDDELERKRDLAIDLTAAKFNFDYDATVEGLRAAGFQFTPQRIRDALGRWEAHLVDVERRVPAKTRLVVRRLLAHIRDCARQ